MKDNNLTSFLNITIAPIPKLIPYEDIKPVPLGEPMTDEEFKRIFKVSKKQFELIKGEK